MSIAEAPHDIADTSGLHAVSLSGNLPPQHIEGSERRVAARAAAASLERSIRCFRLKQTADYACKVQRGQQGPCAAQECSHAGTYQQILFAIQVCRAHQGHRVLGCCVVAAVLPWKGLSAVLSFITRSLIAHALHSESSWARK